MEPFVAAVDEDVIRQERQKARDLRKSSWWTNQTGNGRCFYCCRHFPPKLLTMDHKTPIIRGGRSSKNNLVPSCKDCNNEKKYMLLSEWIAQREAEDNPLPCASNELY